MNYNNGLQSVLFYASGANAQTIDSLNTSFRQKASKLATGTSIKPEDIAAYYLGKAFENDDDVLSKFNKPQVADKFVIDFQPYEIEDNPFTLNKIVRFRQKINNISVYGSNINVEIDNKQNLVSINSSIAPAIYVDTVAKVSPAVALKKAAKYIENSIPASVIPLLYIYFENEKWKLVYVVKNVLSMKQYMPGKIEVEQSLRYVDVILDAQTGNILTETPQSFGLLADANGDDDKSYSIFVRQNNETLELVDDELNVITYDLNFKMYSSDGVLPGTMIDNSSSNFLPAGINAHFNACQVARFLKNILRRNSIDNKSMHIISTVRCIERAGMKEWGNARWYANQMVYGQVKEHGKFKTIARSLDVVAHEIFHAVISYTCKLKYENQSGALNESYSDIFGVIISNFNLPSIDDWNWEIGEIIKVESMRNMADPGKHGQPAHMDNYEDLPPANDSGGVHLNSGIHNKAAHNIMSTKNGEIYLFKPDELAVLFYNGLTQLSICSGFSDSYRSILNAANSLFKNANKDQKMNAIKIAFESVGILDS